MSDRKIPADWAIEKALALRRANDGFRPSHVKDYPEASETVIAFARYIEAHEKSPVDRKLLCAREIMARKMEHEHRPDKAETYRSGSMDVYLVDAVELITLYESGYGKTDG